LFCGLLRFGCSSTPERATPLPRAWYVRADGLTVVLVEDHPMMRSVMARTLEGAGMTVLASTALATDASGVWTAEYHI
jgi:hypothetical protein